MPQAASANSYTPGAKADALGRKGWQTFEGWALF